MASDPLADKEGEETERLSLDLPVSAMEFLRRYSSYRNALNAAGSRKVRRWARKSTAEAFVLAQIAQVVESMAGVIAEHGELPDDDDEMMAFAKAVLAAAEKPSKKTSR